jgi:hypothetical protein
VAGRVEEQEGGGTGGLDDDLDEPTPVVPRRLYRCLPCLGTGRLRLLGVELYETRRPCPYCRGAGTRIMVVRAVSPEDDMKFADLGRCTGAFRPGRRAPFGRVVCAGCGGRFSPLPGLRVPNHVAQRPPTGEKPIPKDAPSTKDDPSK